MLAGDLQLAALIRDLLKEPGILDGERRLSSERLAQMHDDYLASMKRILRRSGSGGLLLYFWRGSQQKHLVDALLRDHFAGGLVSEQRPLRGVV